VFALETWHAIVDPALGYSTKLLDGRCPRSHQRARWIIQGRRLWMAPNAAPQPPGSRPSPSAGNDQEQSAAAALRSVTSDAQDELECAFCALLMLPPYSICGNGHTACSACFEALEALPGPAAGDAVPGRCPSCREPLLAKPVRLLALETAAKRIAVSCRFAGAQGCHAVMPYMMAAAHARVCPWRTVRCGHYEAGATCGATVCLAASADHWIAEHGILHAYDAIDWPAPGPDGITRVALQVKYVNGSAARIAAQSFCCYLFQMPLQLGGGQFSFDGKRVGGRTRFAVRQFGADPHGYVLRSIKLRLGSERSVSTHELPRCLSADESLASDGLVHWTETQLTASRPPVIELSPDQLRLLAAHKPNRSRECQWMLRCRFELRFEQLTP
jgi:hypothetical protein